MDGVALLVRHGFDVRWVLEEIPMPVFRDLVLVVSKQHATELYMQGQMTMIAIGSLFSKETAKKAEKHFEDQKLSFDEALMSDADMLDEDDSDEEYVDVPRTKRRRKKAKKDMTSQLHQFHQQFQRFVGHPIPAFQAIVNKANSEQQIGLAMNKNK